jgi:cytochrome oxidase Cu insertion factor (SCO1/SenC/PrrC family)
VTEDIQARASGRRKLLFLILLFSAPVLAAYTLYFWAPEAWQPQDRSNQGHLVAPARPLENLSLHALDGQRLDDAIFRQKWTLLLVGPSACDEACANALYNTRQVRTALGKNTLRVQRVYVATDRGRVEELRSLFAREHPDLKLVVAEGAEVYGIDRRLTAEGRSPLKNANDIYLLDPHGNWFMFYTPEDPPRGLLKDLKKVLRLSNIG